MFWNPASCFVDAFTVSWASLYFYAFPPFCQMFTEDFRGTCTSGDYDLTTIWSTQVWWPQLLGMVYVIAVPLVLPKHHDLLSLSYSPQKLHPLRKKTDYANMSPFWRSMQDRGISEAAARLIMASWGNGTKKQYSIYNTKLQKFCNQRQVNNIQPSLVPVLNFLTTPSRPRIHYHQHCQKCPVILITLEDEACVGKHPLVPRVMEGTFQEKLQIPKCTDVWQFPFIPSIPIPCGYIAHFSACWKFEAKQTRGQKPTC